MNGYTSVIQSKTRTHVFESAREKREDGRTEILEAEVVNWIVYVGLGT
jgi:hypothetical protein